MEIRAHFLIPETATNILHFFTPQMLGLKLTHKLTDEPWEEHGCSVCCACQALSIDLQFIAMSTGIASAAR